MNDVDAPPFSVIRFVEPDPHDGAAAGADEAVRLLRSIFPALHLMLLPRAWQTGADGGAIGIEQNLTVGVVTCPPGQKPPLHAHRRSTKAFLCLSGRFVVRTRDHRGEAETTLEPLDMISVAPGVYRDFVNVTDRPARLLALCFGEAGTDDDDVIVDAEESRALAERFGVAALRRLGAAVGYRFLVDADDG